MKIIVVGTRGFPNVQGGVETHCENLYPLLVKLGCDVTVFTRPPYASPEMSEYRGIHLIPVAVHKNKFFEAFFHTYKCINIAAKMKPDIIHIHAIGPAFFTGMAKRICRCKVVVTHQGPDYKRKKWPFFAKWFLRMCEWIATRSADEIIVVEPGIARVIYKKFKRNVPVISNGVWIRKPSANNVMLDRFGLVKNKYFMGVGRLVPEKGFHDLIDAYEKVKGQLPANWKLVICGSADHSDKYSIKLEKKAKKVGVILTGYLDMETLNEFYSNAGIFVLSSYYEGLPLVGLEALSYGLPYLMTDIMATKTLPLDRGRLFLPGDVSDLAQKMKKYANEPFSTSEKEDMIRHVRETYSWQTIAEETLEVYNTVLNKGV